MRTSARSCAGLFGVAQVIALTLLLVACGPAPASGGASTQGAAPATQAAPAPAKPAAPPAQAQPPAPAKPAAAQAAKPAQAPSAAKPAELPTARLTFGATGATSSTYPYFVGVAKAVGLKAPSISLTVVETGAGEENLKRIIGGTLDLGLSGPPAPTEAYRGIGPFKDKPFPQLRYLWSFGSNSQNLFVRADSGVQKLEDLDGKAFCPGGTGTGTALNATRYFEILGIKPNVYRGGMGDCVAAMKDRRIVGMGKGGLGLRADASILDVATTAPIRMLGFSDEQIAKIKQAGVVMPWVTVPAGVYPGQTQPYKTWTAPLDIYGTAKTSVDVVYYIVKAVSEDKEHQEGAYPPFKGWDVPKETVDMASAAGVPLHKGAIRYYEEVGVKVPAELKID